MAPAEHTDPTDPQQPNRKPTPEEWAQAFRTSQGRPPTVEEYRAALDRGEIHNDQHQSFEQFGEQLSSGFRNFSASAKDAYTTHVAPTVERSSAEAQDFLNKHGAQGSGKIGTFARWATFGLPAAALLAIISMFLPFVMIGILGDHGTLDFFSFSVMVSGRAFAGILIMLLSLGTIGTSIAAIITKKPLFKVITGGAGALAGLLGIFTVLARLPYVFSGMFPHVGLGLLVLMSLVLIAGGGLLVIEFFTQRGTKPPAAGQQPSGLADEAPPHSPHSPA